MSNRPAFEHAFGLALDRGGNVDVLDYDGCAAACFSLVAEERDALELGRVYLCTIAGATISGHGGRPADLCLLVESPRCVVFLLVRL